MFEIDVDSIFTMPGRGSVLYGRVTTGRIAVGDSAILRTPSREVRCSVDGLEIWRSLKDSAAAGEIVGALCRGIQVEHLHDCYVGEGNDRRPVGVTLVSTPKRWWEFWRD